MIWIDLNPQPPNSRMMEPICCHWSCQLCGSIATYCYPNFRLIAMVLAGGSGARRPFIPAGDWSVPQLQVESWIMIHESPMWPLWLESHPEQLEPLGLQGTILLTGDNGLTWLGQSSGITQDPQIIDHFWREKPSQMQGLTIFTHYSITYMYITHIYIYTHIHT